MNDILDELKKYFAETPKEQIKKDWELAKQNSAKNAPTVNEFLEKWTGIGNPPNKDGRFKRNDSFDM